MLVTNRTWFKAFLEDLDKYPLFAFDTETNGLSPYTGDKIIGMSFYFPQVDRSYYLAFRHGEGKVNYNGQAWETMTKWTSDKKQAYKEHWFESLKSSHLSPFENLPLEWMDEIKSRWADKTVVMHNAKFDLHMLHVEGFPLPYRVYDTMILLHLVNEDWRGNTVTAPFKWSKASFERGKCAENEIGQWARDKNGNLITFKQNGNRQLKWFAAYLQLPNATKGEEGLYQNKLRFEELLANVALQYDDEYNDDLRYKTEQPEEKQVARYQQKIHIDEKAEMWMLPATYVHEYAELDTVLTWGLYDWGTRVIYEWDNSDLWELLSDIQLHVAWDMEKNGILIHTQRAQELIAEYERRTHDIENRICRIAWEQLGIAELNINSPKQLLDFLPEAIKLDLTGEDIYPEWWSQDDVSYDVYEIEELENIEKTDRATLELFSGHPIPKMILAARKLKKAKGTYLESWLGMLDNNNRVHGNIKIDGTVSGRTSSSNPNLQNIPSRGGYRILEAVVPPKEHVIVAIDYGQLEARLAAWIAESLLGLDESLTMTTLFEQGVDMHSYTRDRIGVRTILFRGMSDNEILHHLGYDISKVDNSTEVIDKYCRYVAKTLNFGLLYGGGKGMVSKLLGLDQATSEQLVISWRELFPAFIQAQYHYNNLAKEYRHKPNGGAFAQYVTQPIFGRHRKFTNYTEWFVFQKNGITQGFNLKEKEQWKAWNNIVQGLGGTLTTASILKFKQFYPDNGFQFFAVIHDSVEAYVPMDKLEYVPKLMEVMIDWPMIRPSLTVDCEVGVDNWQDMISWEKYYHG